MLGGAAAQTIFYSSDSNPIELTGDVDLEFIKQQVSPLLSQIAKSISDYLRRSLPCISLMDALSA